MRDVGDGRPTRGEAAERRQARTAAGLLLQISRAATDDAQTAIAKRLGVSPDTVRHYEDGALPTTGGRDKLTPIVTAYRMAAAVANRFLGLLGELPLTLDERSRIVLRESSDDDPMALLFSSLHDPLRDDELKDIATLLKALGSASEREPYLSPPLRLLAKHAGRDVLNALASRGQMGTTAAPLPTARLEVVESLLAEVAEQRILEARDQVTAYVSSGAHGGDGRRLTDEVRDLLRVVPVRRRSELRYLLGWLYEDEQSYGESVRELDRAVSELVAEAEDISSLRAKADANYMSALAYLDVGDGPALTTARLRLEQAENYYRELDRALPDYAQHTMAQRMNSRLQRARVFTWGYRRGLGDHFAEADDIYKELLVSRTYRPLLDRDPSFHAEIYKERGDNLRLQRDAAGKSTLSAENRNLFKRALELYTAAELVTAPQHVEQRVECALNMAYLHRLLGRREETRFEIGRAHRLALTAHLPRQVGHTLLHMAECSWRSPWSRVVCAYLGAAIALRTGSKRNEDVCKQWVADCSPQVDPQRLKALPRIAERSVYAPFFGRPKSKS